MTALALLDFSPESVALALRVKTLMQKVDPVGVQRSNGEGAWHSRDLPRWLLFLLASRVAPRINARAAQRGWFMAYDVGASTRWHVHGWECKSVSVSGLDGAGPLEFFEGPTTTIRPGRTVMFEASAMHRVPPQKETRVSLAINWGPFIESEANE